ncbi:SDR family NAD(P)-dependent oxidoreductase, partial [bacterium]|nr:SDR family NAD(P)-dependent oxidoreductase [bacterium]
ISSLARLDVCINNAGINRIQNFSDISNSDYDELIQVNLKAPFIICQSAVAIMKKKTIWSYRKCFEHLGTFDEKRPQRLHDNQNRPFGIYPKPERGNG